MICFQFFAIAASLLSHPDAHDNQEPVNPARKRGFRMLQVPTAGTDALVFLEHLQHLDLVLEGELQPPKLLWEAEQLLTKGRNFFPDLGTQGEENNIQLAIVNNQLEDMRRVPQFQQTQQLLYLLREILRLLISKFEQLERQTRRKYGEYGVDFTLAKQRLQQTIQRIEKLNS